jgi:choline kinase
MKALILAAGFGSRLRRLTQDRHKVLIDVGGAPLIDYPLQALISAGVTDIGVVVGHRAKEVSDFLADRYPFVEIIQNHQFDGGNALSVLAGERFVGTDPFLVCMGDHTVSAEIVAPLVTETDDGCILCVDSMARHASQINDATRVLIDERGFVRRIGKELSRWNAIDTGVFKMTPDVFGVIRMLSYVQGTDVSITDLVTRMGDDGVNFSTRDVRGSFWADVDTFEDYESVDSLLRGANGHNIQRVGLQAR